MKIIILTTYFLPHRGGIETMTHTLATQLARTHGHEVTILTATLGAGGGEDSGDYRVLRAPDSQATVQALSEADAIIMQSGFPTLALIMAVLGTPRIRILHARDDNAATEPTTLKRRLGLTARRVGGRWWAHRAHRLVAVSDYLRSAYRADLTIHNGFDETVFTRRAAPADRDPLALVTVGRLHPEKGVDLAIRALARLHERGIPARLRVVGDGRHRWELQQLASDLGLGSSVAFEGSLAAPEVNEVLNESAILALPTRVPEAFGIAVLEANAAGCAVVAADGGGILEALDGHGLTFPSGDADALADQLERLIRDDALRSAAVPTPEAMSQKSSRVMAARYAQLIAEVTAGR